jgi:hypothetical protein
MSEFYPAGVSSAEVFRDALNLLGGLRTPYLMGESTTLSHMPFDQANYVYYHIAIINIMKVVEKVCHLLETRLGLPKFSKKIPI